VDPSARPPLHTAGPEEPPPPRDLRYDGNHIGWMVGATLPTLDAPIAGLDRSGAGLRISGRISAITQFIDANLDLQIDRFGGPQASLLRTELGTKLGTHPGFPFIVFNDWTNDVISGVHGYIGASLVRADLEGSAAVASTRQTGNRAVGWSPQFTCGVGADIPVSPRDRPHGWWLTVRYELRWMRWGEALPAWNMGDSQLVLQLGRRSYDNSWARVPRPFAFQ
jgi:hypothetical protein